MQIKNLQPTKTDIKNLIRVSRLPEKEILKFDDFDIRDTLDEAKKYLLGCLNIESLLKKEGFNTFEEYCEENGTVQLEDGRYIFLGL